MKLKPAISLFCILLLSWPAAHGQQSDIAAIETVLDQFHQYAATGNWDAYFDLIAESGYFIGTDVGERWGKSEFRAYAGNRSGWVYHPRQRQVNLTPTGDSAWFHEILDSESYGTSRGTGVLFKTEQGWKIAQYHLTFPVPNPLAREITDRIKAFEATNQ